MDLEQLPQRQGLAWMPTYHLITMDQLKLLLEQGLVTQAELDLWSRSLLPPPRQQWIDNRLALMALDLSTAPLQ